MKHGFWLFKDIGAIFHWNGKISIVSHTTKVEWTEVPNWIELFKNASVKHKFIYLGN